MTGTEACRIIRAEEAEKGLSPVPIIALTAHARTEDRAACAEAGMDGFKRNLSWSRPFGKRSSGCSPRAEAPRWGGASTRTARKR
jgi:CheY-like chemotaxis protein